MRITKPDDALVFLNGTALRGRPQTCVSVGYLSEADGRRLDQQSAWKALLAQFGGQPFDEGLKKTRGTFAVAGNACAPRGTRVSGIEVRARVGDASKTLLVFGDRRWTLGPLGWRQSEPLPFESLPVDLTHAFGGPRWPSNPLGRGYCESPDRADGMGLPNVERPGALMLSPTDRPAVATFLPLPIGAPERGRWIGSLDAQWQKTQFPHAPDDTDPRYFDGVAEDQAVDGYWRGDEAYEVAGMHADHPVLRGNLPALRPRLLWRLKGNPEAIGESELHLDTVWLLPNDCRVLVLYRALIETGEIDGADLDALYIHTEALADTPASCESLTAQWQALLNKPARPAKSPPVSAVSATTPALNAAAQAASKAGSDRIWAQIAASYAAAAKEVTDAARASGFAVTIPPFVRPVQQATSSTPVTGQTIQRDIAQAFAAAEQEVRDAMRQAGMNADAVFSRAKNPAPPPDPAELPALLAGVPLSPAVRNKLSAAVADAQRLAESVKAKAAATPGAGAPPSSTAAAGTGTPRRPLGAAALLAAHARGESLARVRLEDADLSGADLTGARLTGSEFVRCVLTRATLRGAALEGAIFTDCQLIDADAAQIKARGLQVSGGTWAGARLAGADLAGARCEASDFSRADLAQAVIAKARMVRSSFAEARLGRVRGARVTFSGCDLTRVDASQAKLDDALFEDGPAHAARFASASLNGSSWWGVQGRDTDFSAASLKNARMARESRFERARFDGADLTGACARNVVFDTCTFCGTRLNAALFMACELSGIDAHRATALNADFNGSRLNASRWTSANLMGASLRRAKLIDVDFGDANLHAVDVSGAQIEHVSMAGALLTRCALVEARQ